VRGVNGTTAVSHLISTAIAKYAPPADIREYCTAMAVEQMKQGESGWTGQIGGGTGGIVSKGEPIAVLRERIHSKYGHVYV